MTFIIYKYKRFVSLYLVRFNLRKLQLVIDSGEIYVNESQIMLCKRIKIYFKTLFCFCHNIFEIGSNLS